MRLELLFVSLKLELLAGGDVQLGSHLPALLGGEALALALAPQELGFAALGGGVGGAHLAAQVTLFGFAGGEKLLQPAALLTVEVEGGLDAAKCLGVGGVQALASMGDDQRGEGEKGESGDGRQGAMRFFQLGAPLLWAGSVVSHFSAM